VPHLPADHYRQFHFVIDLTGQSGMDKGVLRTYDRGRKLREEERRLGEFSAGFSSR
jgi:hypothetical protein